jgi:hypothetical protein
MTSGKRPLFPIRFLAKKTKAIMPRNLKYLKFINFVSLKK